MLKRIGYFLSTLAVVAVPPMILVNFSVSPDIDWDALGGRLSNGDVPYELLVAVLSGIGWFTWLSTVVSIAVEFVAAVRNFEAPSLVVFPGAQNAGRRLVAGMLMSVNSMTPAIAGGLAAVPIAVPASALVEDAEVSDAPDLRSVAESTDAVGEYRVQRGDTFMSLASSISDEMDGWRTLRSANTGVVMPSGTKITSETISVEPGTILRVPSDSVLAQHGEQRQHLPESAVTATTSTTTIDVGTIEAAADPITVKASKAPQTGASLRAVANTPAPTEAASAPAAGEFVGSWRVVEGDNFWAISGEVLEVSLGSVPTPAEHATYWERVVDANEEHTLSGDPDLIYAGEVFDILLPAIPGADIGRLSSLSQFTAAVPTEVVEVPATTVADKPKPKPTTIATPEPTAVATPAPTTVATPEPTAVATPEPAAAAMPASGEGLAQRFKVGGGVGLVIAAIAAAGVMIRLRKKRDLAHATRLPGGRVDPADATVRTEADQRGLEESALRERLTNALHQVQRDVAGEGDVMLAQVDRDGVIELAFDARVPSPPDGGIWTASELTDADRHAIWTLTGEPRIDDRDKSLPPLVGIGDGTYLNLVSAGTLSIGGGTLGERGDHLRSIIHDLGFGPASGELLLRLGAIGEAGDATVAGVPASAMVHVADEAESFMDVVDREHDRVGTERLAMMCHAGQITDNEVMVVVCAESEVAPLRDVIARVENSPGRYPLAFVILAEGSAVPAARWSCHLDGTAVALKSDELGGALRVEAATMGREEAAALNAALSAAVGSSPRTLGVVANDDSDYYNRVAPAREITETEEVVEALGNPDRETESIVHAGTEDDGLQSNAGETVDDDDDVEEVDEDVEGDDADGGGSAMTMGELANLLELDTGTDPEELAQVTASMADQGPVAVEPGEYPTVTLDAHQDSEVMGEGLPTVLATRMTKRTIQVNILGPVEISGTVDGVELGEYASSLLSAMVFIDRPVAVAEITELLWPGVDIGRRRVREVKRQLRDAVGAAMVEESGRWSVSVESDVAEFERLVSHASRQTGPEGLETLTRALKLVRGAPLEGALSRAWEWADTKDRPREVLRQRVVDTALGLAGRAAEQSEWDIALEATRVGRRVEPYSVELVTAAVGALLGKGEKGLAVQQVSAWEAAFETHFSLAPPSGPRALLDESVDVKAG